MTSIDDLTKIEPGKLLMFIGIAGMVASGVAEGFMGYQIIEGMNIHVFLASTAMAVVGFVGQLVRDWISAKVRMKTLEEDSEVRRARMAAGMEDRTTYKDQPK